MESYAVETKLGTVEVSPVGWGLMLSAGQDGSPGIVVNGVEYGLNLRLRDYGNGYYELERGEHQYQTGYALMMSRKQWRPGSVYANEASSAARRKALTVLLPLANDWAKANLDELQEAKVEANRRDRRFALDRLAQAQEAVDKILKEVEKLDAEYQSLRQGLPEAAAS